MQSIGSWENVLRVTNSTSIVDGVDGICRYGSFKL
jgi:hypothetical protein